MPAQAVAKKPHEELRAYYERLLRELGPQHWWPARTRLEVILGAILVQNTAWRNAALAIAELRRAGLLNLSRLLAAPAAEIEARIRSAGFYRQKARAIRAFLAWLDGACQASIRVMFRRHPSVLRQELLGLWGFGPETVDAILLYAGRVPRFVADAYTRRILARHGFISDRAGYASAQRFLHQHLPADPGLFNEFHALLVEVGKRRCHRRAPRCDGCPLEPFLPSRRRAAAEAEAPPAGARAASHFERRAESGS
jgi:endonuclease-3 related protein